MAHRRWSASLALLGAGLVATTAPVAAGGFGATQVLRTAAAGTEIRVADIAARGQDVVVGWQENAPGGVKRVWIKRSADGGASFSNAKRLDDGQSREVQVDTCDDWVHATYSQKAGSRWLVGLDRYPLSGGVENRSVITTTGISRKPDVACAGERLVVAYFKQVAGVWRVMVYARGVNDSFGKGDALPEFSDDLGPGDMHRGLAIAGTPDRVYITWFDGDEHRMARYNVGGSPDHDLTPVLTPALPDAPDGQQPELGASGVRIVMAYMDQADLRARVSTNSGGAWGPERTLENMPFPSEVGAYPTSADVIGTNYVVGGTWVGGVFDEINGEGFLHRSTDAGGSWDRVAGTTIEDGEVVGAYRGTGENPLLVMAYDKWIADPATDKLRFRRES